MDLGQTRLNVLAVAGLALGAVFGLAGTAVESPALRAVFWGIDGAALVMAACLLALKYFRRANDLVASGFLVFAIGQGIILSGAGRGRRSAQACRPLRPVRRCGRQRSCS